MSEFDTSWDAEVKYLNKAINYQTLHLNCPNLCLALRRRRRWWLWWWWRIRVCKKKKLSLEIEKIVLGV